MAAGTPVSNDLFTQALQQALQASNMSTLQVKVHALRLNPTLFTSQEVPFQTAGNVGDFRLCDSGSCLEGTYSAAVFDLPGPLAVPDAAAQGHGDPGWGVDAEGPAGHRWWHPGCLGAHICWRSRTLNPIPYGQSRELEKSCVAAWKW